MESLLATFHLPFEPFRLLVTECGILVTDNLALDGFLHQNGMESALATDSMNVWVPQEKDAMEDPFLTFLSDHGYVLTESHVYGDELDWEQMGIPYYKKTIMEHPSGAVVMIDYVSPDKGYFPLILPHYLPLSTTCWWGSIVNLFFTTCEETTLQRKVFMNGVGFLEDFTDVNQYPSHVQARLRYLLFFGFEICEEPCLALGVADTRTILERVDPFGGLQAFDLMAYEEVMCRNHLRASPWNMLLQVGDTLHAYDRRALGQMMREKEIMARDHRLFTTPHHQSVQECVLTYLHASDYSVMELVHAYDATLDGTQHVSSVYHVNFYTVEGWQRGDPGKTVMAPLRAELEEIEEREDVEEHAEQEEALIEPYVAPDQEVDVAVAVHAADVAIDAVLADPDSSSAARHDAMMALYRSAEQELEQERVLMAELAEQLAHYVRERDSQEE